MTIMFLMSMFAYAYAFITSNFLLQEPPVHFNQGQLILIGVVLLIVIIIACSRKKRKK